MAAEGQEYMDVVWDNGLTQQLEQDIAAITTDYFMDSVAMGLSYLLAPYNGARIIDVYTDKLATNHYTVTLMVNGKETGIVYMSQALSPTLNAPRIRRTPKIPALVPVQLKVYQPA